MKKWLKITLGIVGGIVILLVVSIYILLNKGYGMSVGRYLEDRNGKAMFIRDRSPISMHNRTNWDLYSNLDTGDKIFVVHTGIAESYPGQTGVYAIFKLSNGTIADIPQNVIKELTKLGWFEKETYTYEELYEMSSKELLDLFIQNGLVINDDLKNEYEEEELQILFKEHFNMWCKGVSLFSHTIYIDLAEKTKVIYDKLVEE